MDTYQEKMKIVIYQALILYIIVMIDGVNTLSVTIDENVRGLLGGNGTQIECLYTMENVRKIDSVAFLALHYNATTFVNIITYIPDTESLITTKGQYLIGRVTLRNITSSSTKAVMVFNNLLCRDNTLYKCSVRYINSDGEGGHKTSNKISISVQVPPSIPNSISVVHMPADTSVTTTDYVDYSSQFPKITPTEHETVSTFQSVTLKNTTSRNYSTLQKTNYDTTSSIPLNDELSSNVIYRTTTYSTQKTTTEKGIVEGDIITVICRGDVGKPPAEYVFEKYLNGHIIPIQDTVIATSISELSDNCSYYRTSNITFQVKADHNNAVIRCVVNSSTAEPDMYYVETEPLEVYYQVRIPTIINYPNKTDYVLGEDTSIHLFCKSDGNPKPSYYWYKENPKEQVSSNENFTITNMNIKNSGTYTCEVNNSFHGESYQKAAIVNIKILNTADKTTPSISGSWLNKAKGGTVIAIAFVVILIVIGVVGILLYRRTRSKEDYKPVDSMGSNMDQIESQIPTRGVLPTSSTKKSTGYEDVDLDDTDMKFKPVSKEETIAKVKQHNEEYLRKHKEDEEREKDNPTTPPQAAVYACVNKPKNTVATENKLPADQQEEDVYKVSKEGLYDTSGDRRHKENITAEHFDSIENLKSADHDHIDLFSEQKSQNGAYINKAFENDFEIKEEKRQVATVSPTVRSSFKYTGDGQDNKSNQKQPTKSNQHVKPEDLTVSTEKQSTHETSL